MITHGFFVVVAVVALAVAGLTLGSAAQAIAHRARETWKSRWWLLLIVRGGLIACSVALSALSLSVPPPPIVVNQLAPGADSVVAFAEPINRDHTATPIVGVSARDGVIRWTRALDGEVRTLSRPTPNVILAVTFQGTLYALRASDGAVLWRYYVEAWETSGVVVSDVGQVFAVESMPDAGASIVSLDLRSGDVTWRVEEQLWAPALTAEHGLVFVVGYPIYQTGTQASDQWQVAALGEADGSSRWTRSETFDASSRISHLVCLQDRVIIVFQSGSAAALRARDGALAWTVAPQLASERGATPYLGAATSDGANVFLLTQPNTINTGEFGAQVITPPATLRALDARDGAVRWRATVPPFSQLTPELWSVEVMDGVVLVGPVELDDHADWGYNAKGSVLTALDVASGQELWRDNTPAAGVSWDLPQAIAPQGVEGVVYLQGVQADPYVLDYVTKPFAFTLGVTWLYAVNVHTGAAWWRMRAGYISLIYFIL